MSGASGRAAVATCRHCRTPIVHDDDGRWIHTSLAYTCRDRWGGVADTYAEPATGRHHGTASR